jgi:hypothetical protein
MPQVLPYIATAATVYGATKDNSKQTVTQKLDPQTQAAQQQLFSAAQQAAQQPFTPYTGPMVAGFSPDQLQAFQAARGLFGETQAFSPISQLQQLAQTPLDVSAYMSPYQEAVIDPALRGIQERQDIAELQAQKPKDHTFKQQPILKPDLEKEVSNKVYKQHYNNKASKLIY